MGAHAKYNNTSSLGIALLGNFEINEPTKEQIAALAKLSTALMIRYKINPDNEVYAHVDDDNYPYIKDVIRPIFMGHRDTGKTACPGKNLYSKLPEVNKIIRDNIKEFSKKNKTIFRKKELRYTFYYPTTIFAPNDSTKISIPYSSVSGKIKNCKTNNKNIKSTNCISDSTSISANLTKQKNTI